MCKYDIIIKNFLKYSVRMMNEIMKIKLEAREKNLNKVISFCKDFLTSEIHSDYNNNLLLVAVEEIFINISSYAYQDKIGYAELELIHTDENMIKATFTDRGSPFNPLEFDSGKRARDNIDSLIPGGLGIYIVKNTMKNLKYEYIDGCNIFSFETTAEEQK